MSSSSTDTDQLSRYVRGAAGQDWGTHVRSRLREYQLSRWSGEPLLGQTAARVLPRQTTTNFPGMHALGYLGELQQQQSWGTHVMSLLREYQLSRWSGEPLLGPTAARVLPRQTPTNLPGMHVLGHLGAPQWQQSWGANVRSLLREYTSQLLRRSGERLVGSTAACVLSRWTPTDLPGTPPVQAIVGRLRRPMEVPEEEIEFHLSSWGIYSN